MSERADDNPDYLRELSCLVSGLTDGDAGAVVAGAPAVRAAVAEIRRLRRDRDALLAACKAARDRFGRAEINDANIADPDVAADFGVICELTAAIAQAEGWGGDA